MFIRTYKKHDLDDIKKHMLIYGDVSGQCSNCQATDLKLNDHKCPKCSAEFKYVSFRHVKTHIPKLQKIAAQRPSLHIIDYDDYSRNLSAQKARDFLK